MFCPNCGAELREGVRFCPICGMQFANAENSAAPDPAAPVQPTQEAYPSQPVYPEAYPSQQDYQAQPVYQETYQAQPVWPDSVNYAEAPSPGQTRYQGMSYMQGFRICSGLLILFSGITSIFSMVMLPLMNGASLQMVVNPVSLLNLFLFTFLAGLMSLILSKPDRVRSIILSVVLGLIYAVRVFLTVFSLVNTRALSGTLSVQTLISGLNLPLLFCLIMALVSIGQPERLVGVPEATAGRPWKIISGILHLLSGFLELIAAAVLLILAFAGAGTGLPASTLTSVSMFLLALSVPVIAAGFTSVRAGGGRRAADFSNIYTHMLVLLNILTSTFSVLAPMITMGTLNFKYMDENIAAGLAVGGIVLGLLVLWYLVCFIVALASFLKRRHY